MSGKTTSTDPKSRKARNAKGGSNSSSRGTGRGKGSRSEIVSMSSTAAQNGFGHLLDTVAKGGTVFIKRRNAARAVVMSMDRYQELTQEAEPDLDELTAEFDALLEGMQTPEARAGIRAAFSATPDELAKAAVAVAREDRR